MLELQSIQPAASVWPAQARLGALGQRQEVLGMATSQRLELAGPGELFEAEFTNRLEHAQAQLTVGGAHRSQQVLGHQRIDQVEDLALVADGCRRLEAAAADEDRQAAKQRLLVRLEQVVAPGDGVAQRLLAGRRVARAARQQLESTLERPEHRAWRRAVAMRAAASSMASGSPSRRRQISDTATAFSSFSAKSGLTALARSTNRRTASLAASADDASVRGVG